MQDTEEALIPEASLVLFVPGVKHPYTGSWFKVSSERLSNFRGRPRDSNPLPRDYKSRDLSTELAGSNYSKDLIDMPSRLRTRSGVVSDTRESWSGRHEISVVTLPFSQRLCHACTALILRSWRCYDSCVTTFPSSPRSQHVTYKRRDSAIIGDHTTMHGVTITLLLRLWRP